MFQLYQRQTLSHCVIGCRGMGNNLYINPENVGPIPPQEGKCCTTGEAYVTLKEKKRKRKSQLNCSTWSLFYLFSSTPHLFLFVYLINYLPAMSQSPEPILHNTSLCSTRLFVPSCSQKKIK